MSFLSPAFLGALALIGVPLLIHLIRKRKLRVVQWAAMDFLLQSAKKQRRKLRVEELLLLLLRMLIVALAVLAFARPVLRSLGIPLLSQNARVYAVVALDNSYSMDFRSLPDNKTSWERAQQSAADILTKILKPGDSVSVVLLSDKPEALINAPSFDRQLALQRIRAAHTGDRSSDYLVGAQLVDKLLKASSAPVKEVYWLTDDQANAWASSKREQARSVWEEMGKQARVAWVSAGAPAGSRENLSVSLSPLARELVTPYLPARIEAKISNHGAKARNDVAVNLIVDDHQAGSARVSVAPGAEASVRFMPLFSRAGTHTGRVELADPSRIDGLTRDNAAPFVVRTRDRLRVLVQDMHPNADPGKSDSFYLLNAMAPGGTAESFTPKIREGEGFGGVTLRDYAAIVVTGLGSLSTSDVRALSEYVKAGGGLLLFPGVSTVSQRVNADLGAAGLLPARLGERKTLTDETAVTLNPSTIRADSFLSLFRDTTGLNLASARFLTYHALDPITDEEDPNAVQTLVRFSDGEPAFVERHVGLGKVILAASSAGAAWNQLALKPSYVPLVYQLLSYLGQGAASHRNLRQDEPLFLSLPLTDANKQVRITDPDGRVHAQNSVLDARGVTFTYADTQRAGLYRAAVAESPTQDAFAVSLPTGESDLRAADANVSVTQAGLPANRLTIAVPDRLQASIRRSRYGAEFWRPFIFAVIALLFLESFLAQRFGRRG